MPQVALGKELEEHAIRTIDAAVETHYTHHTVIDTAAGRYDVDCSAFVGFLLQQVAARHYAMLAASTTNSRPLAHDFYRFAARLPGDRGWQRVIRLDDAIAGDIVAWELPERRQGDTGHVFVVAAPPVPSPEDDSFAIKVYDATSILHFDDSRGTAPGEFATGIGSGVIHLRTDDEGAPSAFRFDPRTRFETVPIAIARIVRFSDN